MKPAHVALAIAGLVVGAQLLRRKPHVAPATPTLMMMATLTASKFPSWKRDQAAIEASARTKIPAHQDQRDPEAKVFLVTRDALSSLWPNLPWPQDIRDQEPIPTPGAPEVLQPRWVVDAGATGNAMKTIWDRVRSFVIATVTAP